MKFFTLVCWQIIHYIAKRDNSYNKTKGIRCTRNGLAGKTCYIDVICNMVKRKHETIPELCKTWNLKDKLLKFATRIYYPIWKFNETGYSALTDRIW